MMKLLKFNLKKKMMDYKEVGAIVVIFAAFNKLLDFVVGMFKKKSEGDDDFARGKMSSDDEQQNRQNDKLVEFLTGLTDRCIKDMNKQGDKYTASINHVVTTFDKHQGEMTKELKEISVISMENQRLLKGLHSNKC